jgi:uncharacterized membrane protein
MSRVVLVGESWFTYSVHQKGFDAFYTSEYVEGGDGFIAALHDAGHEVSYIPSHEIVAKDGAQTLAECAGHPLLVIGEYEQGRAAAFASDIAPHWAPPGFTQWSGCGSLFDRLVRWVAREDLG